MEFLELLMVSKERRQKLFLCAGLQGSGSTLVSWCFMQHPELNGVLDMPFDYIQTDFSSVKERSLWVKMTVASFSWHDLAAVYRQIGYEVIPVLVVRNPYRVWHSLIKKSYGRNSITAEDPPIIIRFRRFLDDWNQFKQNSWPIVCTEKFVRNPRMELRKVFKDIDLSWSDDCIEWPKEPEAIAYAGEANQTFLKNLKQNLSESIDLTSFVSSASLTIPGCAEQWITNNMKQYLTEYGYTCEMAITDEEREKCFPDPYVARRYLGFRTRSIESYNVDSILKRVLESGIEQVYIFGACRYGQEIARRLVEHEIVVVSYIDNNPKLWGTKLGGIPVESLSVSQERDSFNFVIASYSSRSEIQSYLKGMFFSMKDEIRIF